VVILAIQAICVQGQAGDDSMRDAVAARGQNLRDPPAFIKTKGATIGAHAAMGVSARGAQAGATAMAPIGSNGGQNGPPQPKTTSPQEDKMFEKIQHLTKLVEDFKEDCCDKKKADSTPNCCTDYTFVPTYDRCADCHYASWYKPRLNETTSKIKCLRMDSKALRALEDDERDACHIFEHHDRLVEQIRCTDCRYVMLVDGSKNKKAALDPSSCKCRVEKGEVRDLGDSLWNRDLKDGSITLKDSRGHPVSAGIGREWTSIPKFRVAKDSTRLARGFKTEEVINMVCEDVDDTSTCHVEVSLIKSKASVSG